MSMGLGVPCLDHLLGLLKCCLKSKTSLSNWDRVSYFFGDHTKSDVEFALFEGVSKLVCEAKGARPSNQVELVDPCALQPVSYFTSLDVNSAYSQKASSIVMKGFNSL